MCDGAGDGLLTLTVNPTGESPVVYSNLALDENGENSFRIKAKGGETIDSVSFISTVPLAQLCDIQQVRIGGVASSANALADHLSIVWLTPAMDRLFMDSPGGRRRFLDRLTLALHPAHAVHSARYEAAMRARNRLLNDLSAADPSWLSALETQMDEHGAALAAARADLVSRLQAALQGQPDQPFARPLLAIEGEEASEEFALRASAAAMPPPAAPSPARTARISPLSMLPRRRQPRSVRPASRRRCCSPSCLPTPRWSRRIVASPRYCCSTKWRRISTPRDGLRCSTGCANPAVRSG